MRLERELLLKQGQSKHQVHYLHIARPFSVFHKSGDNILRIEKAAPFQIHYETKRADGRRAFPAAGAIMAMNAELLPNTARNI
jgi:hypothetical protein